MGIECLIAGALVWVWWRNFLRPVVPDLLVAAALLGFDLALLWNLRTGNVALVEQALVWLGLVAYTRGRLLIAAVLIGLASIFKLYPIVFLALLLSPSGGRGKAIPIVLGLGVVGSLLAVPLAPHASWAHLLVAAIKQGPLPPDVDPSSLSVAGWALSLVRTPIATARWMAPALYILFVAVLISANRSTLARAFRSSDPMARVMTALILMYLVSPRVMVYSYASAVPPALFVLDRTIPGRPWRVGASLLLLLQGLVRFLPGPPPTWLGAVSFLIMLAVWILWTRAEGPRAGGTV